MILLLVFSFKRPPQIAHHKLCKRCMRKTSVQFRLIKFISTQAIQGGKIKLKTRINNHFFK